MPTLTCDISTTLMQAVLARRARTGESVQHIVMSALAEALEVEHATLFQVSTAGALVGGLYSGVVTIGALKQHGDFGLGTFEELDGEMLALDGRFYRVQASGAVSEVADDVQVPFAVVTLFRAEREAVLGEVESLDQLTAELDRLRRTANLFCAVRIEGRFRHIRARVARRAMPGETLVAATAHQAEFEFADVTGTLVGFWSPAYTQAIAIGGWHLHVLTADRAGGGHVLACQGTGLRVSVQDLADVRIALPETAAYLQADLNRDPSGDLNVAEGPRP